MVRVVLWVSTCLPVRIYHADLDPEIIIGAWLWVHRDMEKTFYIIITQIFDALFMSVLRHVKAVQDFSAGCSTSIRPQIDVPFIK